jgi:hypothetical protein
VAAEVRRRLDNALEEEGIPPANKIELDQLSNFIREATKYGQRTQQHLLL